MSDPIFFTSFEPIAVDQIATWGEARVVRGDARTRITGLAPLDRAQPGDLVFIDNTKYLDQLSGTQATACLCAPKFIDRIPDAVIPLETSEPYRAFARITAKLYPEAVRPSGFYERANGISERAIIHETATLETGVTVEPGAVIGAGAQIGEGSFIAANAAIGHGVCIGRECAIGPNTSIQHALIGDRVIVHGGVQIGQDGFGFAMGPGGHLKVPQVGRVVIQDDVEIGANTTIDRGANRDTIVGEGTKIDNQVQIAHNVVIGRHCILVSMVGISGSSVLEDYAVMAGKAAVSGHLRIGMGAQIAGASNVASNVPAGERWIGTPAKSLREWTREKRALEKLAGTSKSTSKSE